MPICDQCGLQKGIFEIKDGICKSCKPLEARQTERQKERDDILLTTEMYSDLKILSRIDIVTAECVFGMNVFRDFFAGMSDFFGGRSSASQKVLRDARKKVLDELRGEALAIGANAVIGVDLDYSEFSGKGKGMLFIVASGTAVIIEK